jgi:hypothetical protein
LTNIRLYPSQQSPGRRHFSALAIFCVTSTLCFAVAFYLRLFASDDSCIHLRISRHLIESGHPYYNLGEAVMVTSSPVWTILLALSLLVFRSISPAIPLEAFSVGAACASSFLLACFYEPEFELTPPVRTLYLFLSPILIFLLLLPSSVQQMESPLAVALILAGVYSFEQKKFWWPFLFILAAWTRYEYFLLLPVMLIAGLRMQRLQWKGALISAITFLAGLLWLLRQFGTAVPNTIKAKASGYVLTYRESADQIGVKRIAVLCLFALLIAIASRRSARRLLLPTLMVLFSIGLVALYVAERTFIFAWYIPVALVPLIAGLTLGMFATDKGWGRVAAAVSLIVLMPCVTAGQELAAFVAQRPQLAYRDAANARVDVYRLVGHVINQSCPTARLLTSEIGGLGIGFPGEILDALGLATPAAIRYHPMPVPQDRSSGGVGAIPPAFVNDVHPDVVVSYSFFTEALAKRVDRSIYEEHIYQPLPAIASKQNHSLNGASLYVLIAKDGACSPSVIDAGIRDALQNN